MSGILDGVRVLDFGRYIAGPLCAALLADLGADVIRVESPKGGDDRFLMPAAEDAEGAMFLQVNRNKRALTLDMTKPEAAAVIHRLVPQTDVVIANLSAGALKHLGLDYETLKSLRSNIILATISAFGSNNALSEKIGFDGVGQALNGSIYLTGEPGKPYRSATSYVDYSTAFVTAFGVVAALLNKNQTGQGMHVESSLAATALNIMNPILIEQATGSNSREPTGSRSPIAGPSDVFRAKDGWFIMQVIGKSMFKRWTALIGRPDLFEDPLFANDILRGRNGAVLSDHMAAWSADKSRDDCLVALTAVGIAAGPVLSPAEIMGGTLGLAGAFFRKVDYPGVGGVPIAIPPVSMSNGDVEYRRPPQLGEHTDEVLANFGFDQAEIAQLRCSGAI